MSMINLKEHYLAFINDLAQVIRPEDEMVVICSGAWSLSRYFGIAGDAIADLVAVHKDDVRCFGLPLANDFGADRRFPGCGQAGDPNNHMQTLFVLPVTGAQRGEHDDDTWKISRVVIF